MEELEEGDIIVFNHPYAGNVTHPNDTVILMPVFAQWTIRCLHRNAGAQGGSGRAARSHMWPKIFGRRDW